MFVDQSSKPSLSTRRSPDPDHAAVLTPSILASDLKLQDDNGNAARFLRCVSRKKHCALPSWTLDGIC
jgi:hypothetical protein